MKDANLGVNYLFFQNSLWNPYLILRIVSVDVGLLEYKHL